MTDIEKREMLASMLAPDTDTEDVLDSMVKAAESLVLNRMYPFGYSDGTVVPGRYEGIQVQLAVVLYSQRGAEGQTAHSENGISRTWPEKSQLLARIVPHVGSVANDA